MAISPVLQHIHAVQAAVDSAAEMLSWPITDVAVTRDTIRVASRHESMAFKIGYPGGSYDAHRRPMAGGGMPHLLSGSKVHVEGRRRRGKPGAAMSLDRLIMLYGVIEHAAHASHAPIAAIHVRGRFFRVTCGTQRRWLMCTRARRVPYPPYDSYDETRFVPMPGAGLMARLRRSG